MVIFIGADSLGWYWKRSKSDAWSGIVPISTREGMISFVVEEIAGPDVTIIEDRSNSPSWDGPDDVIVYKDGSYV